ncbi:MAG TPA: S8 family serine peptidase [Glycomyces sp.]|nr:S8 family serine peptidase [Glycomyces sp.]
MTSSPRLRRILASAFAGALLPSMAAAGAWAQAPGAEPGALLEQKAEPEVLEQIDRTGEAELWLRFTGAPDWSDALAADEKEEKGRAAVEAAHAHAEDRQADVIEALEAAGAEYETFWASATIRTVADAGLLEELAALDQVEAIVEAPEYGYIEPIAPEGKGEPAAPWAERAEPAQDDPAWNLEQVRAPELWAEGVDGEGIVVASIDSGVQYDHPALVDRYRGNNGDGTFTHDYNFFDATGECGGEPCDEYGHGTHTMGTMVGDDGEGNRIGVAPGAEWIAASAGASPTLESFLAAGQWIAAPTDAAGDDPDPAMAPHVVNNSWSGYGGYDPFYADVIDLWHAAGIVPVFAAGNDGENGCLTVGSPGLYENVIAVGATDADGAVTTWSSKGPGMDGLVKPDVVAPGDAIVSSIPGDEYGEMSGTSMAAPHVAGAVALMLSASPKLEGDYDRLYRHLTRGAVEVEDDSCSGNRKANNVFGHGHIDAYEAVEDAPAGRFGTLSGLVTDEEGEPVSRAKLVFEGPVGRVVFADAAGAYAFERMPVGEYEVTVSRYFYESVTGTVEVKRNGEAVFDAALRRLPARTVEGVVVDGSGQGWPLAATVSAASGRTTADTDPLTGAFAITVPAEGDWPLTVESLHPGYAPAVVDPDEASLVALATDDSCAAPGYGSKVFEEDFDSLELPEGWEVVDHGEGEPWVFDDPYGVGNETPGTGGFAQANSDASDPEALVDTDLITAPFDLSAADDPTLRFATFFLDAFIGAEADVAISTDGGETWEEVWSTDMPELVGTQTLDLSAWADATAAQLKFHYTDNGTWSYFWQVDDVAIGCEALDGGLVTGTIVDADGEPAAGGVVYDEATGAEAHADEDGRYVLFTDAGPTTLAASAENYGLKQIEVEVVADAVTGVDFVLD